MVMSMTSSVLLLLVVHHLALELFAVRIGSAHRDSAGLAIGRHNNATADRNLSIFLGGHLQRAVINLLVRPRVHIWVAGDGIVFAVELARPLVVRRVTVLV